MTIKKNKNYFERKNQIDLISDKSLQKNKYVKMMNKIKDFFQTKTNSTELVSKEFEQFYDNSEIINFDKDDLSKSSFNDTLVDEKQIKRMISRIDDILKITNKHKDVNEIFKFNDDAESMIKLLKSKQKEYEQLKSKEGSQNEREERNKN
ncbi:hypothetical protein MSATCC14277_1820 [Metamycoplasma salivarium]|uniref:hypothetical protein n=1 Tax=Metamycoplasma salivarium TaxID=2124 RepID=UPI000AEBE3C9|nr:hypothetical protein [Metamycoplasma salivarium]GIZ05600.1 hypothetical protein MSATCC14277_1820 [Metamycoplasma salivarium]